MTISVFVSRGYAVVCPSELRKMQTYPRRSMDGMLAALQDNYWIEFQGQWICSWFSPDVYPPECASELRKRGVILPVYLALVDGQVLDVHFEDDRAGAVAHFQKHGYIIEE